MNIDKYTANNIIKNHAVSKSFNSCGIEVNCVDLNGHHFIIHQHRGNENAYIETKHTKLIVAED